MLDIFSSTVLFLDEADDACCLNSETIDEALWFGFDMSVPFGCSHSIQRLLQSNASAAVGGSMGGAMPTVTGAAAIIIQKPGLEQHLDIVHVVHG